jgi:hypothetical protein
LEDDLDVRAKVLADAVPATRGLSAIERLAEGDRNPFVTPCGVLGSRTNGPVVFLSGSQA